MKKNRLCPKRKIFPSIDVNSFHRYRLLSEMSTDFACTVLVRADGKIVWEWLSRPYEDLTGYSLEEVKNMGGVGQIIHPDDRYIIPLRTACYREKRGGTLEYRILMKDGKIRWVRDVTMPVDFGLPDETVRYYGITHDITPQKKAEEMLGRQAQYLVALQDILPGLLQEHNLERLLELIVSRAAVLVEADGALLEMYEPENRQMVVRVSMGFNTLVVGMRVSADRGVACQVVHTRNPFVVDHYNDWAGRQIDVQEMNAVAGFPIFSGDETVLGALILGYKKEGYRFRENEVEALSRFAQLASVVLNNARLYAAAQREIVERTQMEDVLRQREHFLSTLIGSVPGVVFRQVMSPDGKWSTEYISPGSLEIIGIPAEEFMTGKATFGQLIPESDMHLLMRPIMDALVKDIPFDLQYRYLNLSKQELWLQARGRSFFSPDHRLIIEGIITDVTVNKRRAEILQVNEARLQALLEMNQMTDASEDQVVNVTLEQGVRLTTSTMGFLCFLDESGTRVVFFRWSRKAMEECRMDVQPNSFDLISCGRWADAVRLRRPVILNHYASDEIEKKLPEGHPPLNRVMTVPVFDGARIVAVAGMANKASDYDADDVRQLSLMIDGMWHMIRRQRDMEKIRQLDERRKIQLDVATDFVRSPLEDIGDSFRRTLQRVAAFLNADCGFVLLFSMETDRLVSEYYWVGENPNDRIQSWFKEVDQFTWMAQRLSQGEPFIIRPGFEFPPEAVAERRLFAQTPFRYLAAVPLMIRNRLQGYLSFIVMEREVDWAENDLSLAVMVAPLLATVWARKNAEDQRLRAQKDLLQYTRRLEVIEQLSGRLRRANSIGDMLQIVLETTVLTLEANYGGILLNHDNTLSLELERGECPEQERQSFLGQKEALWNIARRGQLRYISHLDGQSRTDISVSSGQWVLAPLLSQQSLVGLGCLWTQNPRTYHEEEKRFLTAVTEIASNAIHRTAILEMLEQRVADRTRELAALYDVTMLAGETSNIQDLLERLLRKILEAVRSDAVAIYILDEEQQMANLMTSHGFTPEEAERCRKLPILENWQQWRSRNGQLVMYDNLSLVEPELQLALPHLNAYLGTPMRVKGKNLGILAVYRKERQLFSMEDIALMAAIAEHAAGVIENARLRQLADRSIVFEERQRIARELHDSVTQTIYSLSLLAQVGRDAAEEGDAEELSHSLDLIGEQSIQALKEMRLLLFELRPSILEQAGLIYALNLRFEAVERRAGMQADLFAPETLNFSLEIQAELYRIIVEALNNALKHAAARRVTVSFDGVQNGWLIQIKDDGRGFAPEKIGDGGLGLRTMRERAAILGGEIQVTSVLGEGTDVVLKLPDTVAAIRSEE